MPVARNSIFISSGHTNFNISSYPITLNIHHGLDHHGLENKPLLFLFSLEVDQAGAVCNLPK